MEEERENINRNSIYNRRFNTMSVNLFLTKYTWTEYIFCEFIPDEIIVKTINYLDKQDIGDKVF